MEIDGTYRLAVQTRVEQPLRIPQLGTLWKRQPHRVLEGLADADDAVVGPDGHPLGAGGLLPLHLFDYARVGAPDESPQLAQPLTPPPAVLRTMSSICWDADASLISTLCCGWSAPSGPKGSVPCPCGGCSQANNTAAASPPTARIAIAGCAGSSFLLSSARAPSRSIHCGQRGEVFPRSENLWVGNQDASQIRRDCMDESAGDRPGAHRSPIIASMRSKVALRSARRRALASSATSSAMTPAS